MKPITKQDVIRFLEGMINDPDEACRVLDALDENPQLAKFADWLSEDTVAETPRQVPPDLFPSLKHSRLWRLTNPPDWAEVSEGGTVTTAVKFESGHGIESFPLTLTRQGDSLEMTGDWPSGWRPFGFVLAQFDFVKGRVDPECGLVPFSMPVPWSVIRPIAESGIGQARTAESLRIAAAKTLKAERAEGKTADRSAAPSKSRFLMKCRGRLLDLTVAIPAGQDGDIVVLELNIPGQTPICFPVQVKRQQHPVFGEVTVDNFPWPEVAGPVDPTLTLRPMTDQDLPLLNASQVSSLLSWQDDFCFVPIQDGKRGAKKCEFRFAPQIGAANDRQSTWLVRMIREGGDA